MRLVLELFRKYRALSLGIRILIFMILGFFVGLVLDERAQLFQPVGDLFIRLLILTALPLIFFNLIAGMDSVPSPSVLGKWGLRLFGYFVATTLIALVIGIAMTVLIRPGVGMRLTEAPPEGVGDVPSVSGFLFDLIPSNMFAAFATGEVAQVVVVALGLGLALLTLGARERGFLSPIVQALASLFRQLVVLVLKTAPIGIGALTAATVGQFGSDILSPILLFVAAVWIGQLVQIGVYVLALRFLAGRSPMAFFRDTGALYATTASTCSSLASLVVSLDIAEKKLKLPNAIYSFALPLGAQLNKDGTAMMLSAVVVFTAQAAGVPLNLESLGAVIVVGFVLSFSAGGIPGGGLVAALVIVQAMNLPLEVAAIVSGIYRLLDIGNTTINMMGDLVGAVILDRDRRR